LPETAVPFVAIFGLPCGFYVVTREAEVFPTTQPGVREVVMGEAPDARLGGGAYAFVEAAAGVEVNREGLQAYCRGHIAGNKAPRGVDFVDGWPLTRGQRIQFEFKGRAAGRVVPSGMAGGAMNA
jgi:acyl-CoA synthetase (AMP-forming)/AMP-acid ligase II